MCQRGMRRWLGLTLFSAVALGISVNGPAAHPTPDKSPRPLSPREELATFQIAKGFRVEQITSKLPQSLSDAAVGFALKCR